VIWEECREEEKIFLGKGAAAGEPTGRCKLLAANQIHIRKKMEIKESAGRKKNPVKPIDGKNAGVLGEFKSEPPNHAGTRRMPNRKNGESQTVKKKRNISHHNDKQIAE